MKTTVIGAYPKPNYLKITDWFNATGGTDTANPTKLYASGGGARVPLLQFISNLLKIPIENSSMKDSTAFGLYKLLNPNYNYPNIKSNQIFFPSKIA